MYIGTKQLLTKNTPFPTLYFESEAITVKESATYLGLTFDQHLTWNEHVTNLCSKLRAKVGALSRVKNVLPHKLLCTFYNSTMQSLIDYGILSGGSPQHRT